MVQSRRVVSRVPAWMLALGAMFSVQLGSALSLGLVADVGASGTAWLRLTAGGIVFLAIARPRAVVVRRRDIPLLVALGISTGVVTASFLAAIDRIPLGTAVAIEFIGPLTVAAVTSRSRLALVWPFVALGGVVLVTQPWRGSTDTMGVVFAAIAALGWALYIVLTQRVGDRYEGVTGLAFTVPVAAITAGIVGIPQAIGHIDLHVVMTAMWLALLLPVIPFALELLALRRMTTAAFGTLMALEPAIGVLLGVAVLHQAASPLQLLGIGLVVVAGAGAQRGGRRDSHVGLEADITTTRPTRIADNELTKEEADV